MRGAFPIAEKRLLLLMADFEFLNLSYARDKPHSIGNTGFQNNEESPHERYITLTEEGPSKAHVSQQVIRPALSDIVRIR